MEIQLMEQEDVPHMINILKKINCTEQMGEINDMIEVLKKDTADMFSNANIKPTFWVAKEKDSISGFIARLECPINFKYDQLYWLMVDPQKQGIGIGNKLVTHVIKVARSENTVCIILSTPKPKYFEQFGFKSIDVVNGDTLMSLKL